MPDENKLAALAAVGFQVLPTCGLCTYSAFRDGEEYGTCLRAGADYQHAKHGHRQLPAFVYGTCPAWQLEPIKGGYLVRKSGFDRFMEAPRG